MLDRISPGLPLIQTRASRSLSDHRRHHYGNCHTTRERVNVLTSRFRNALRKSVEGIIEAGRVLIEAKGELEHGQFTDWVVRELRFGTQKEGNGEPDIRKAEMLMYLARNEVISNPCHWHAFPPSPRTLWELTQIRPKQRLLDLITSGKVNAGMTREDAVALRRGRSHDRLPAPRLKREVAALVEACILLGGGDGVLAHIRDLKDVSDGPPAKEFDRAARWARRNLAERRQSE